MKRFWSVVVSCFFGAALVAAPQDRGVVPGKGGEDVSGPYEVVPNWPLPISTDLTWGRTSSIYAESPDRVFVIQSGMVPWSWKRLQDARNGGNMTRRGDDGTYCGSSLASLWRWNGKNFCQTAPDGRFVDSMVEFDTGKPIPGAKWDHIVMVFNREGKLIESWEQWNHLFSHPHHILVNPYDPEKHIWIVDAGSDQIFKFTNDGKKLVMVLGESRVPRSDQTHFKTPTSIAFLPNGDFYVSDGYFNTRVVKFSKDGKYLMEWGKPGKGPGEFDTVHAIAIDAKGRVYVDDRGNSRIQVFDLNGKYQDEWPNIRFPLMIQISKDQHMWVSDGEYNKILKYNLDGQLLYSWGTFGDAPGHLWGPHFFTTDSEGNLYTADAFGGRAQKFRPRKGADPRYLVGPLASPGSLNVK